MVVDLAHRTKAARTLATNSTDAQDCRTLLSMLGLEPEQQAHDRTPPQAHDDATADCTPALTRGAVSVETDPLEPPILLSLLGGQDPVPDPLIVAHFVTEVLDGRRGAGRAASPRGRTHLAE